MTSHVWLYTDTFGSDLFAQGSQRCNGVNARFVTLRPVNPAHLGDKSFSATHFHTVNDVSDVHAIGSISCPA
jgi:hypothetical protein